MTTKFDPKESVFVLHGNKVKKGIIQTILIKPNGVGGNNIFYDLKMDMASATRLEEEVFKTKEDLIKSL